MIAHIVPFQAFYLIEIAFAVAAITITWNGMLKPLTSLLKATGIETLNHFKNKANAK